MVLGKGAARRLSRNRKGHGNGARRGGAASAAAVALVAAGLAMLRFAGSASQNVMPVADAHGLGCEGYQLNINDPDFSFSFRRDVGLRQLLGANISRVCSNWRSMPHNIPAFVTAVPPWQEQPTLFTFECVVKTTEINEILANAFPLKMYARGCGQSEDEHWEMNVRETAECGANVAPGETAFNLKVAVNAERHQVEGLPYPHSWVFSCSVAVGSSPRPLEVGDSFTIDYIVNDARAVARSVVVALCCFVLASLGPLVWH